MTASTNATMPLADVSGPWASSSPADEKTVMVGFDAHTSTSLVQLMDVTAATVDPAERGTGYHVNDVLTIAGGTLASGGAPATVKVTQVNGGGGVEAVSIEHGGLHLPTGPPGAEHSRGTTPRPFRFYAPSSTANFYSAYLHRHDVSIGGLAYGDQGGFSTNIDLKRTNPSLMAGTAPTTSPPGPAAARGGRSTRPAARSPTTSWATGPPA